jgi:hypothetical protein
MSGTHNYTCGACGGVYPNIACGYLRNAKYSREPAPCYQAVVDYYESHEALIDLVQLWAEHEALTGGGPNWQTRFQKALAVAIELTRRSDGAP